VLPGGRENRVPHTERIGCTHSHTTGQGGGRRKAHRMRAQEHAKDTRARAHTHTHTGCMPDVGGEPYRVSRQGMCRYVPPALVGLFAASSRCPLTLVHAYLRCSWIFSTSSTPSAERRGKEKKKGVGGQGVCGSLERVAHSAYCCTGVSHSFDS
jgi:hypothetical protein